ncbi:ABC transporter ATP-binding protein [Desulfurispira natronophila]|uniref:Molybdate transport system ATP-binding protein n=1 Tax=Desulfurispira natronophila TaxID=682562 RepID=A0A7W7Y5G3_9BACT|nr:ATP-binding cassette domain-containing protein [Desulfurispira natronophila]MBB5022269.1 molybdate transport system ATP-binding protein [Desulfurispira natronophila]
MININVTKRLHTADGPMELEFQATVEDGQFVTLFGPSGAGKTTLLRMVAGLTTPDEGTIQVNGQTWFDSNRKTNLTPRQRSIGMVFQDYALFPHMSVAQNIGAALPRTKRQSVVRELLEVAGLLELASRKPDQLSGGQRQRVALARALALQPSLLLLDEPLSALDLQMRLKLQEELLSLHRRYQPTTLLVSHDMSEVFRLSNQVFVLELGQVVRSGSPADVFASSGISNKFRFTGEVVHIVPSGVISIVHILVGSDIVQVVATDKERESLQVGKRVLIASKAFNPLIMPLEE